MPDWLGLMLGCALGGMARVYVASVVGRAVPTPIPWNTLIVNVSGAVLLGLLAGYLLAGNASLSGHPVWQALGIGLLGSYTTVSSFSLQTLTLFRSGHLRRALANIALSVGLCLPAVAIGLLAGSHLGNGA